MIKKSLLYAQDNKHRKRHHKIFCNISPPIPRRLDNVSKNSGASKKNRVNYSTDSDTSSNSNISDSSDLDCDPKL